MDFAGLVEGLSGIILQWRAFVEMDGDRELTSVDLDHRRGVAKQFLVFCEVLNSQSGGHDHQLHGHPFLGGESQKKRFCESYPGSRTLKKVIWI